MSDYSLGEAVLGTSVDLGGLHTGLQRAKSDSSSFGSSVGNVLRQALSTAIGVSVVELGKTLINGISGMVQGAAQTFMEVGKQAVSAYASYEKLGMSLTSLVAREKLNAGEAKTMTEALAMAKGQAQELLAWTQKLALESPFTSEGVSQAFKTAMAYGFTAKESQRLAQAMIDFAAGSGASEQSMGQIALALGQIKAKGKLAGSEVLQLVNTGLPVTQILANAFGKTTAEIGDMQEKGLIPAQDAIEALIKSLETDFGGAAKRMSGTFSGLLSSMSDLQELSLRNIAEGTLKSLQPALQTLVDTLSSPDFQARIKALGDSIGEFVSGPLTRLTDAFKTGGLNGLLQQAQAELTTVWGQIEPILKSWGEKAWDWITGPNGLVNQAGAKLKLWIDGMISNLSNPKNGESLSDTLYVWVDSFWEWLIGKDGVISQALTNLDKWVVDMTTYLESDDAKKKLYGSGLFLGESAINGLDENIQNVSRIKSILDKLFTLVMNTLKLQAVAIREIGEYVGMGIFDGMESALRNKLGLQVGTAGDVVLRGVFGGMGSYLNLPNLPGPMGATGGAPPNSTDNYSDAGPKTRPIVIYGGLTLQGVQNSTGLLDELQRLSR